MSVMKEAMNEAMGNSKLNPYVWKGHKEIDANGKYVQNEQRMVDMSEHDLNGAYDHCRTMLFNKDSRNPGRHLVLSLISDQRDRCGAELFLRNIKTEKGIDRFSLVMPINVFKGNNAELFAQSRPTLDLAFQDLPDEFRQVPIDLVLDACIDRLGAFNKKHITRAFILRQGVWLTPSEAKDLTEKDENNQIIDKLTVIRDRLNIKDVERLSINSRGLNYTELRAMLSLRPNKKYADLTTVQLETLRNRILFVLEESVKNHITAWEERMSQIEQVADNLGIKLK